MTLVLRDVAPTDLDAIHAIYAYHVVHGTGSWEYEPPDRAEMARRYEAVRAAGYPYLVAEVEGRVGGLQLRRRLSRTARLLLCV